MNKRQGNKYRNWKGLLDTLHPSARVYFVYIYWAFRSLERTKTEVVWGSGVQDA